MQNVSGNCGRHVDSFKNYLSVDFFRVHADTKKTNLSLDTLTPTRFYLQTNILCVCFSHPRTKLKSRGSTRRLYSAAGAWGLRMSSACARSLASSSMSWKKVMPTQRGPGEHQGGCCPAQEFRTSSTSDWNSRWYKIQITPPVATMKTMGEKNQPTAANAR